MKFLSAITATGGGDYPEDVIGGLSKAVDLEWPASSGTRVIFHLADAPPHGRGKYHDSPDDYPDGHRADKPLDVLFAGMKMKGLTYNFGRINTSCDKMLTVFEPYCGEKIEIFDDSDITKISSSVVRSVTHSISLTCSRSISTIGHRADLEERYHIDKSIPVWTKVPVVEGTIVGLDLPSSIEDIVSFKALTQNSATCKVQVSGNPFDEGCCRLAFYGRVIFPENIFDEVVFKEMLTIAKIEELNRQRYMCDLEVQTIAAKIAFVFNDKLKQTLNVPKMKVKFLMAKVIRFETSPGNYRFMAHEKKFRGISPVMVKYTNNMNYVISAEKLDETERLRRDIVLAFSHFSYDITGKYLLVCDLQGVHSVDRHGGPTVLLTDPAIHCEKHHRFGKTNHKESGFKSFFKTHVCNNYCRSLGLSPGP